MESSKIRAFIFNFPFSIIHLFHIFLRAVVHDPEAHFPRVGSCEELDAGAVKEGAEPGFRVQAQILCDALLMPFGFHNNHLPDSLPADGANQSANPPYFQKICRKPWEKTADLSESIDFLAKATYTNKIQHTHMEEQRNA